MSSGKRLLINLDAVGEDLGLDFSKDLFLQGTCDDGFVTLATALGWLNDLNVYREQMCDASVAVLDNAMNANANANQSPSVQQKEESESADENYRNKKRLQNETRSSL